MDANNAAPMEPLLSRRRLLSNSAKLTAAAAAFLGTGLTAEPIPIPAEFPKITEEIAGHWTTF